MDYNFEQMRFNLHTPSDPMNMATRFKLKPTPIVLQRVSPVNSAAQTRPQGLMAFDHRMELASRLAKREIEKTSPFPSSQEMSLVGQPVVTAISNFKGVELSSNCTPAAKINDRQKVEKTVNENCSSMKRNTPLSGITSRKQTNSTQNQSGRCPEGVESEIDSTAHEILKLRKDLTRKMQRLKVLSLKADLEPSPPPSPITNKTRSGRLAWIEDKTGRREQRKSQGQAVRNARMVYQLQQKVREAKRDVMGSSSSAKNRLLAMHRLASAHRAAVRTLHHLTVMGVAKGGHTHKPDSQSEVTSLVDQLSRLCVQARVGTEEPEDDERMVSLLRELNDYHSHVKQLLHKVPPQDGLFSHARSPIPSKRVNPKHPLSSRARRKERGRHKGVLLDCKFRSRKPGLIRRENEGLPHFTRQTFASFQKHSLKKRMKLPFHQPLSTRSSQPLPPSSQASHPLPPSSQASHPLPPSSQASHPFPPSSQASQPLPPSSQALYPLPSLLQASHSLPLSSQASQSSPPHSPISHSSLSSTLLSTATNSPLVKGLVPKDCRGVVIPPVKGSVPSNGGGVCMPWEEDGQNMVEKEMARQLWLDRRALELSQNIERKINSQNSWKKRQSSHHVEEEATKGAKVEDKDLKEEIVNELLHEDHDHTRSDEKNVARFAIHKNGLENMLERIQEMERERNTVQVKWQSVSYETDWHPDTVTTDSSDTGVASLNITRPCVTKSEALSSAGSSSFVDNTIPSNITRPSVIKGEANTSNVGSRTIIDNTRPSTCNEKTTTTSSSSMNIVRPITSSDAHTNIAGPSASGRKTVISNQFISDLEDYRENYSHYLRLVGIKNGGFNSSEHLDIVCDEILEEVLQEVAEEVQSSMESCIEQLFDSEFHNPA